MASNTKNIAELLNNSVNVPDGKDNSVWCNSARYSSKI